MKVTSTSLRNMLSRRLQLRSDKFETAPYFLSGKTHFNDRFNYALLCFMLIITADLK